MEHVVDELKHLADRFLNPGKVSPTPRVQRLALGLVQRPGKPVDPPERRPQVMRNRVAEALQLSVLELEIAYQDGAGLGQLPGRLLARPKQLGLPSQQRALFGELHEDRDLRTDELRRDRLE